MKNLLLIFAIGLFYLHSNGQSIEISATSRKTYISFPANSISPPFLEIRNYQFIDKNDNNLIDAGETVQIIFEIYNSGTGPSTKLEIHTTELNQIQNISFKPIIGINDIQSGESQRLILEVSGDSSLPNGKAIFSIVAREGNGFHSDPILIEVGTSAFKEPLIKIVDYQVSNNSGTIEKRRPFDLEVLVQNIGQGNAYNVALELSLPQHVFCLSANEQVQIGTLVPGEIRLITHNLVTNNEFSEPYIDLGYSLSELYQLYGEDIRVQVSLNQSVSTEKLIIEGEQSQTAEISVASLSSDVDRNIPENSIKNPNKIALIIGNENYSAGFNSEINVDYARRDASIFRNYAIKTLGVPERNVYYFTDATSGVMKREIDRVAALIKRMGPQAELIFFYAGHGYPDDNQQAPYLIPVDVNASNLSAAVPLRDVYQKFGDTDAKLVTVILDACFSGGGRNQGLLAARAVRIKPREESLKGNMVVFAAAQGDQSALPYHEQKHGLMSYFMLKKLQESSGGSTFGEIADFLKARVGIESIRNHGRIQDPEVIVSPSMLNDWRTLSF